MQKLLLLLFIFVLQLIYFTNVVLAQSSHANNIAFPVLNNNTNEHGGFVGDILYAQNMIFVYTPSKVLVYEATGSNNFIKAVSLITDDFTENEYYGKFSPLFFNTRMHVNEIQLMTYNEDANILYVLGTDLRIYGLNTNINNGDIGVDFVIDRPTDTDIGYLAPLHGIAILKYDNYHNKLYCVIEGRNIIKDNAVGSFHNRDVYFTIYSTNLNGTVQQQIYDEFYYINNDGSNSYDNAIMDIEFNENTFDNNGTPFSVFYLARNGSIEVYKIQNDTVEYLESLDVDLDFYKVGKMLYINQNNIHKILVFPYRTPTADAEPPFDYSVHFYQIDGSDPTVNGWGNMNNAIVSPHKRILDATFISGQDDLMLCYSNDNYKNIDDAENTDIAFYSYDFLNENFGTSAIQYLNTNGITSSNLLSLNRPLKLHAGQNNILVSKKDNIIKVLYDGNGYIFNPEIPMLDKESNYFYKGAISNDKFFILNLVKNGFEVLNQNIYEKSIRTGFQALNIKHNPAINKLYFYNTLNVYGNGMYLYDLGDEIIESFIELEKPIGDVIYNPFQNHMLVSENSVSNNQPVINIIENNILSDYPIILSGMHHLKEMFVAPNGRLYVASNMRDDTPIIIVIDANDYSNIIGTYTIPGFTSSANYYDIFNADFCYNPYNQKVYATITTNNTTAYGGNNVELFSSFDPYYSVLNSTLDYGSDLSFTFNGALFEIADNGISTLLSGLNGPREIICSTPENSPLGYLGNLFIAADRLIIYDCETAVNEYVDINFNDITYSSIQNKLYGFADMADIDPSSGDPVYSHRTAEVYSVDEGGVSTLLHTFDGQLASIFTNQYNGLLYLHAKVGASRLGSVPVSLVEINPITGAEAYTIALDNKSHYVELDYNKDYHFHNYNLTTPYINPVNNKIYLPNGAHSNVSVVNFDANETMLLKPQDQLSWLSFPRLSRDDDGEVEVNLVLSGNIDPDNYTDESRLENRHKVTQNLDYSSFTGIEWDGAQGGLLNIQSSLGYKLKLNYIDQPENVRLQLHGTVLDSKFSIPLVANNENWTGYWIYQQQDIFDALADFKDELYMIKHQDYFCYYGNANYSGGTPVPGEEYWWICDKLNRKIDYGEMVVLKSYDNIPAFQWNYSGNLPIIVVDEELEYYAYTETADYSAFVIELDSTENPVEMGAFVNDSCIGACTLTPEDTLVIIKGYLGSQPGDSVVFEEYFSQKATNKKRISDYYVFNSKLKIKEKRVVKTGENKEMYFISFKPDSKKMPTGVEYPFSIFPNPTNNMLNINYSVENTTKVSISVCDIYGKQIATLLNEQKSLGTHAMQWNLTSDNGVKVPNGLYIIKLKINDVVISRKVVVN